MSFAVLILVVVALYLIPSLVAFIRGRHNTVAIVALNVLLGWTLLGWVISLVWALSSSQPNVVVVERQGSTQ